MFQNDVELHYNKYIQIGKPINFPYVFRIYHSIKI